MRNTETEERILWVNKNKQNYTYPRESMYFNKDGSITNYKVEIAEYQPTAEMPQI